MRRHHLAALAALIGSLLLAFTAAVPAQAAKPPRPGGTSYPSSMASLGDSITRGFNAAGWYSDAPERSWSTGTYASVNSHYSRLLTKNKRMKAYNNARSGAKMAELPGQAATAVSQGAQYVTVLMGANDACTSSEGTMTSVESFRTSFSSAMTTLAGAAKPPQVLVTSIPDVYRLYEVGKTSSSARSAWSTFGICQSMLANPTSTDEADEARRQRVRQQVVDYNAVMTDVCADYSFCKDDGGVVFSYPFTLSQLSTWDYFHPNTAGQAVLAAETWKAGFWPTN
ncbi:MAG TPA: SGNH/GDSL hydrolase family protein [Nocardioidaceae bacterium]